MIDVNKLAEKEALAYSIALVDRVIGILEHNFGAEGAFPITSKLLEAREAAKERQLIAEAERIAERAR